MNKKFNLNGVDVELSKEKLQEMLKEFDALGGEVKEERGYIVLFKNGKGKRALFYVSGESIFFNLSIISRDMAVAMDDLMETKDVLDDDKYGYYIYLDAHDKSGNLNSSFDNTRNKHFKTRETAKLAAKLLSESEDVKGGIRRVSK